MGLAAVVSLEKYQAGKWQEGLRAQMHQALDNWLDEIESEMKTPKPTLEEITKAVFQDREKLTKVITEGLILDFVHQAARGNSSNKGLATS